ncbi:hypothetical protein QVD17_41754 [Tagetes erecta]|uniref:Uncharacterized protein n=1 Tax=Tagetes erecta TaxID=13708 RepID=A0AAD8N941_TARER|nr:hypothetical protein QVD17_41754 [Tagetes erecta]
MRQLRLELMTSMLFAQVLTTRPDLPEHSSTSDQVIELVRGGDGMEVANDGVAIKGDFVGLLVELYEIETVNDRCILTFIAITPKLSSLYDIGIYNDELLGLANILHCKVGKLPFPYLGLNVGANVNLIKKLGKDCGIVQHSSLKLEGKEPANGR